MNEQISKTRLQADAALLKAQSKTMNRDRILSETEILVRKRDANTARLRELRLSKEAADRLEAPPAPTKSRSRKAK